MQINSCIGRLTKNIELRYTSNQKAVCDLNIAVDNGKEDTSFLRITVFGQTAENCSKYLTKGSLVGATYTIKNHNWDDEKGNKHYDYQFLGNRISFLTTKKSEETEELPTNQTGTEITQNEEPDPFEEFGTSILEEDLPF